MRNFLILFLALLNGCYSYAPVASAPLARGTAVRARLAEPADIRLTDVSVNNTSVVVGEIVAHDADTLTLSAFSLRAATGYSVPAAGETVKIPAGRVARIERRRLDVLRSALLVGTVAVGGTLLFASLGSGFGGRGGGGGRPAPQ